MIGGVDEVVCNVYEGYKVRFDPSDAVRPVANYFLKSSVPSLSTVEDFKFTIVTYILS